MSGIQAGERNIFEYVMWRRNRLTKDQILKTKGEREDEEFDILNWTSNFFNQSVAEDTWDKRSTKGYLTPQQIRVMCTFLPDELINMINQERRFTTFVGALMFADISGFTNLSETYSKFGPEGAYRLTSMLNNYIGAMVDLIFSFGGDVLKFAGDAFLAVWHVGINDYLSYKIHEAISCAMHIQFSQGTYVTDVGVVLKVKIAISAGNFVFSAIGDAMNSSYVIYGLPVVQAKKAESMAESGDTIIAPSAWSFIQQFNYIAHPLEEGYHKMKNIVYVPELYRPRDLFRYDWKLLTKLNSKMKAMTQFNDTSGFVSRQFNDECGVPRTKSFEDAILKEPMMSDFIGGTLRPFIIAPVMQQIDFNSHSMHSLTEMRQVTIMFLTFKPKTIKESLILKVTDIAFITISKIVKSKLGIVNKVCLFDKDIMFLVIFGMKGFKEKDEITRCLRCAYQILFELSQEELVENLSIGVTSGTTYCGVVGHPFRKEYTVIGGAVNKAARLMCAFRGVVSCDHNVVLNSKLPFAYFSRLPPKFLKGIGQVTNIFKYEEIGLELSKIPPLLGRTEMLSKFEDILSRRSDFKTVMVQGLPRAGKTRLMSEFVELADSLDWKTIWISVHTNMRYGICLLHKLFSNILGRTVKERMSNLIELFINQEDLIKYLYILNDVFDVNFAFPVDHDVTARPKSITAPSMFKTTMGLFSDKMVIFIDDAHCLDNKSWYLFSEMLEFPNYLLVLSLPISWKSKVHKIKNFLRSNIVIKFYLENLNISHVPALISQMIQVKAVPRRLVKILTRLSRGNPGWVQTFLLSYLEAGAIVIKASELANLNMNIFMLVEEKFLKRDVTLKEESVEPNDVIPICKVVKHFSENALPATFDDVIMGTVDRLSAFEQFILKCASVLGNKFFREDLMKIMNDPPEEYLAPAIKRLFQLHVLGCANKVDESESLRGQRESSLDRTQIRSNEIMCHCSIMSDEQSSDLPKFAFCKYMAFKFQIFCSTIYATIILNIRTELHIRAWMTIESRSKQCSYCTRNEEIKSELKEEMEDGGQSRPANPEKPDGILAQSRDEEMDKDKSVTFAAARLDRSSMPLIVTKDLDKEKDREKDREKLESEKDMAHHERNLCVILGDLLKNVFSSKVTRKKVKKIYSIKYPSIMKCTCYTVLAEAYEQLIHHAHMAGNKHKLKILTKKSELYVQEVHYLILASDHALSYGKYERAVQILKDAEVARDRCLSILSKDAVNSREEKRLLDEKKKNISSEYMKYSKKHINVNLGLAYVFLGRLTHAAIHLGPLSDKFYSYPLFLSKVVIMNFTDLPESYREKLRVKMELKSKAHLVLSRLHLLNNDLSKAANDAKLSLRYGKKTYNMFQRAESFANSLDINMLRGNFKSSESLIKKALKFCAEAYNGTKMTEVIYFGQIFTCIFKLRYFGGQLMKAIAPGLLAMEISQEVGAIDAEMFLLSKLCKCLAMTKNLKKLSQIITTRMHSDIDDPMSYQFLAKKALYTKTVVELFQESGVAFSPPCKSFTVFKHSLKRENLNIDHQVSRNKCIFIWLWHLRRQEYERASAWTIENYDDKLSCDNIFAFSTLLQCYILWMVHKIDAGEFNTRAQQLIERISIMLDDFKSFSRKYAFFCLPRCYHLKAYFALVCADYVVGKNKARQYLGKGFKIAVKQNNFLEQQWIRHSILAWWYPSQLLEPELWVQHSSDLNFGLVEVEDKHEWHEFMFTLKLPKNSKIRREDIEEDNSEELVVNEGEEEEIIDEELAMSQPNKDTSNNKELALSRGGSASALNVSKADSTSLLTSEKGSRKSISLATAKSLLKGERKKSSPHSYGSYEELEVERKKKATVFNKIFR